MKSILLPAILALAGLIFSPVASIAAAKKPLRVLLITGGCCHDYGKQKDVLKAGIEARANIEVTQVHSADTSTKARFAIYEDPNWAKDYDAVIHDECSADVKDMPYVTNILNAHKEGVGAVNLHCAMHSYRTGTEDWFEFVGLQSTSHGPQLPIQIQFTNQNHAIVMGFENWTTINEELYNNVKIFPKAYPLARGRQVIKRKDGTEKTEDFVVAWVNRYGKGKVFSTTLGHNTATVADDRYLDLVTRGVLWSCNKLEVNGKPVIGYAKPAPAAAK